MFFKRKDNIYVVNDSSPKEEREAIVILVGFGSIKFNPKRIAEHFSNQGYDIFQPAYIQRKSIAECTRKIEQFTKEHNLKSYKKLHFVCYIIGAWSFNNWIKTSGLNNIETVIYDRSPLQERAPYALIKDIRLLIVLITGKVSEELAKTPYPPLENFNGRIGLLIESIPTKMILKHKKSAAELGPLNWSVEALKQSYSDYFYADVNHDDMYTHIEKVSPEIWNFIKTGSFSPTANRIAPTNNPLIEK